MQVAPGETTTRQYLGFTVAGESYAVGILQVHEILAFDTITAVPGAPPFVRGVINLRGAVVPVIDLARRLCLRDTPLTPRTCIVIVDAGMDGGRAVVGLLADTVTEVLEVPDELVQAPPDFGTPVTSAWLRGMARAERGFVLLLDVERVVGSDELEAP